MHPLATSLRQLDPAHAEFAVAFVERCLAGARAANASDLHLQPTEHGMEVRLRVDGVLQSLGTFPRGATTDVIARLKVLAQLLTYRVDVPQEGRLPGSSGETDVRVGTFPTVFGERAVVRFFPVEQQFTFPEDLGLPGELARHYAQWLQETAGLLVIAGPAGAGKSTTAYAGLRHILRTAAAVRSVITLEDPVEVVVAGAAQCQINPGGGLTMANGLRSLLRQDPEVIFVGEIRDVETAELAFQAALTGHLVLSTFHAGHAVEGLGRLLDMGIEPYVLRSALQGIMCQRLLRSLCRCARPAADEAERGQLPVTTASIPTGCADCGNTGYRGRRLVAEWLPPLIGPLGQAVLERRDVRVLGQAAHDAGMKPMEGAALELVAAGTIAPVELLRVFGARWREQGTFTE